MVRTRSGCWTCRLQTKKKCDEAKPECKRCTGLGIRCFGYGPRPRDDELGDDRRALIAPVGATSRTEDSAFRVWRLKPTLRTAGSATRPAAHPRQRERQSSTWQMLRSDMSQLINIYLTLPLEIFLSAVVQSVKDEIQ